MKKFITLRLAWLIWAGAVALFLILVWYPVSYRITRASSVVLLAGIWFGLLALNWRRPVVRWVLVAVTVVCAGFFMLPSRTHLESAVLRREYVDEDRPLAVVGVGNNSDCRSPISV